MVASVKHARVRNSTQCICDKHLYLFVHQDTSFGFPPSLDATEHTKSPVARMGDCPCRDSRGFRAGSLHSETAFAAC